MKSFLGLMRCATAPFLLACQTLASSSGYCIGLNFGADEYPDTAGASSGAGRLAGGDIAGVASVKQANRNNLDLGSGSAAGLMADNLGAGVATAAGVEWSSNNTWASTRRGEENNGLPAGSPIGR